MEILLKQGEDSKLEVALMEGTTPIVVGPANAGLVHNIKASLIVGSTEVAKYSLNAEAGFGELQFHATENHKINMLITREQSKTFPIGVFKVATLVTFIDADFPNGRNEEYVTSLGRVIKGEAINL